MAPVASARAVVDIRESRVEVSVRLNQICRPIAGQIGIYIVHVNSVTQRVIRKYGAARGMTRAALVPGQDAPNGDS